MLALFVGSFAREVRKETVFGFCFSGQGASPFSHARASLTGKLFSHANPEPVTGDRFTETRLARLWAVLMSGHARKETLTGQQEMENVRALNATILNCGEPVATEAYPMQEWRHSEPCGFPFLSHFRSGGGKRIAAPRDMLHLFLGGLPLFSALSFRFNFALFLT